MKTTRRTWLKRAGMVLAGAGLAPVLMRCGAEGDQVYDLSGLDAGTLVNWAQGGTAAMTAKASYPNPFTSAPDACVATCQMTLGPCYAASPEREDISEGRTGVPVRFMLRLLDTACAPIAGARVDIWHCEISGRYSGDDASDFCTAGNADARANRFFRGTQRTDAEGIVRFDTCFPGWYSGRSVHIHYRVVLGSDEYCVSQLFFPEAVTADVFTNYDGYQDRGQPDTRFSNDNVLGGTDATPYVMELARMDDGVMLASKSVIVRRALSESVCTIEGSGGGMGPP